MNPQSLAFKKDGVGTYIASVIKQDGKIWSSLEENDERRPIWKEIETKYPKDMEEYYQMLERKSQVGSERLVM